MYAAFSHWLSTHNHPFKDSEILSMIFCFSFQRYKIETGVNSIQIQKPTQAKKTKWKTKHTTKLVPHEIMMAK